MIILVTIKIRLASITSNAGDKVELAESGVTCLVGGNNAGKSRTLADIASLVETSGAPKIVIDDLQLTEPGPVGIEEVVEFLEHYAVRQPKYGVDHTQYAPLGGQGTSMRAEAFAQELTHGDGLGQAKGFFFLHATPGQLTHNASGSVGHIGAGGTNPASPLHRLFLDGALEEELSTIAYEAFEQPLTVDRANMDVRLRVGEVTDVEVPPLNRPTLEYANALAALPALSEQGDGVQSFIGIVVAVLAGRSQMLLLDEPEAFLHPGQARALGRWLSVQAKRRDLQIVLATHSRDLVVGLLEGNGEGVHFVRIVRDRDDKNHFHELRPDEVNVTWADPVLRYSNVLQGLFHSRVVICEADGDCRFYGAVLDELANERELRSQVDNLLLVPSGGKAGVATLAKALRKLGVETHAFVDFDVLNNKAMIKGIVEGVGGAWTGAIEADFLAFVQPVQQGSLWPNVKRQGLTGVPDGEPYAAAFRLLKALDQEHVHVVPSGEMESFDREIGEHGPAWVSEALKRNVHRSSKHAKDYAAKALTAT
jgi:ABC-type cobalamin/Fe3+-siderophores transport system ATPase subunit